MSEAKPLTERQLLFRSVDRRLLKGRFALWRHSTGLGEVRRILAMTRRPILLGGSGRSGTTLLLSVLSAHPNIYAIAGETGAFCPTGYNNRPDFDAEFRIEQIYDRLLADDETRNTLRWCEKTPKNVQFIGRQLAYFGPGARCINLVRDGRDVVTSVHPEAPSRYWVAPQRWVDDVSAGQRLESHPQVLTVKYEDLVTGYEAVLRTICDFLGEEFHPALMQYPESARIRTDDAWFGPATTIHPKSIQRWQDEQHAEVVEQLIAMPRAVELLRHYDYLQ
ncbi:MAG: sulfotransferase [Acidobacteriota bacterium]